MKKVLITGIEGFVGTYLAEYLHKKHYRVFGIHFTKPTKKIGKLYQCDIREYQSLLSIIKDVCPDIIFHLAAQSSVAQGEKDIQDTFTTNTQGTLNILEVIKETKQNPRFIYISSCEVYGPSNKKLTERSQTKPVSFYALSKLLAENICRYYYQHYNFDIVILRPFSHTGPGQSEKFIFPRVARKIAEIEAGLSEPYLLVGNIDIKRDYTDISDIVKAYYIAIKKCQSGETYNITSGKPYSLRKGVEYLISLSKRRIEIKISPELVRTNDIRFLSGSAKKFIQTTGWQPKVNFFTTLTNLLNYYRAKIK